MIFQGAEILTLHALALSKIIEAGCSLQVSTTKSEKGVMG
jgi:hypothetical protein